MINDLDNIACDLKKSYLCDYFNKFVRTHSISKLRYSYLNMGENFLFFEFMVFSICGRIFRKRVMGKVVFLEIKDISGKIQLYMAKREFNDDYKELVSYLNVGDIIGIRGTLFKTKTNELSLRVLYLKVLSKNFNSFPDKRFGLLDKENCYRQRYLDLMVNDETKRLFLVRSHIISKIRSFFFKRDFMEVETPVMQLIPGGAEAKPFETYHNYLNSKLYFRISPELYLKRLIVGGFEKVFEIGKSFRNEGVSTRHHPEFTTIEFYQAYSDYKELMDLTEMLLNDLSLSLFNKKSFTYNGVTLDFSVKFKRISFFDSILEYCEISKNDLIDRSFLCKLLAKHGIDVVESFSIGELQFKLFEQVVEKQLIQPTFILHHPVDVSPLARTLDCDKNFVERFEFYICGREIANGFSELNDPYEQEARFLKQLRGGENHNSNIDKDYINALRYGLPPTAGEGIGIDRLIMLFTDSSSIKDVILFPLMRIK